MSPIHPFSDLARARMVDLRHALLNLHKALLDSEEPATAIDATRVIEQARMLLKPSEDGSGFGKRYYEALQRDPDVVLAHAAVKKLLRKGVYHLN